MGQDHGKSCRLSRENWPGIGITCVTELSAPSEFPITKISGEPAAFASQAAMSKLRDFNEYFLAGIIRHDPAMEPRRAPAFQALP